MSKAQQPQVENTPTRRRFFAGAATVGVAAAAATALPGVATQTVATQTLPTPPENGGGYSLSEHVKRYYQTTRV